MAGIVKSVESLTITYDASASGGTVSQNLTGGQTAGQCIPLFTKRVTAGGFADDWVQRTHRVDIWDNGGTAAVQVKSNQTDIDDYTVEIFVVEFDTSINVQKVSAELAAGITSANVAITDVGSIENAFMLWSYYCSATGVTDRPDYAISMVNWGASTSSDGVAITRVGNSMEHIGVLYVVDCDADEFTVQHIYVNDDATGTTGTVVDTAITSVALAESFVINHYRTHESGDDPQDASHVAHLTTATNVRSERGITQPDTASSAVSAIQVVTIPSGITVQRGLHTTNASASQEIAITSVDLSWSTVHSGCHYNSFYDLGTSDLVAGNDAPENFTAFKFNSATELGASRDRTTETGNVVPWEVITWVEFTAATGNRQPKYYHHFNHNLS